MICCFTWISKQYQLVSLFSRASTSLLCQVSPLPSEHFQSMDTSISQLFQGYKINIFLPLAVAVTATPPHVYRTLFITRSYDYYSLHRLMCAWIIKEADFHAMLPTWHRHYNLGQVFCAAFSSV